jgi:glycosyltransferase involved in cell wall biosynthesis/peptidoglycan/xylan/chitin deacetylase (PgdA/CDA1 family)
MTVAPGADAPAFPEQPGRVPQRPAALLSVVIPTRNRKDLLGVCLESLGHQSASPAEYEVVVVVDGATDGTQAMLAGLETRFELVVVEHEGAGSAASRNLGAARASGGILLFIDDDEVAGPNLVASHIAAHEGSPRSVVIGSIERRVPKDADRYAQLGVADARWQIEQLRRRPATFRDCFGGNCSVRREDFELVGGYAARLPLENDTEFGYRLHQAGCSFVFAPEAVVSEYRTRGWRGIIAESVARGRAAVHLYERHPAMLRYLPLGGAGEQAKPRLRRALENTTLALHLPPVLLGALGFALPKRSWVAAWNAFVSGHSYWTGVRQAASPELWKRARGATLVLGYHAFGADGEGASRYVLPGKRFARQLRWLVKRRYNVITLGELAAFRAEHRFPPPRSVVITIDDAYAETAGIVAKELEHHGLRATLFVLSSDTMTEAIDSALAERKIVHGRALAALPERIFEIGSHTRTHRRLTLLEPAAAQEEIEGSKHDLEELLGRKVDLFAYPFGDTDADVERLVAEAEYTVARGTKPGRNRPATPDFDLRWLEICGTYSLFRFAATLVLGELRR